MVALNEDYRVRELAEQKDYLNVVIKSIHEIEKDLATDAHKKRPLDSGKLERLIRFQRSIWHGAEVFASLLQEGDNKRYIAEAQKFGREAMYAIGALPSNLAKANHFVESAQYHEKAKEEMVKLAQMQQQMAAMQQQQELTAQGGRGKEGGLEKSARRNVGEQEGGEGSEGGVSYDSRGRQYEHAEARGRSEHRGGGNLRYSGKNAPYKHSLNALVGLAGVAMIMLTGMPHLTGGVIGGSASGYAQMIGGFLILLAIGMYFVNKNRL